MINRKLVGAGAVGAVVVASLLFSSTNDKKGSTTANNVVVESVDLPTNNPTQVTELKSVALKVERIEAEGNQVVILNLPINYLTITATIDALEEARKSGADRAFLVIDSPGGSVFDGAKLIDYIKSSKMRIDTICDGLCASMGAQIHQAGHTRYMNQRAMLMFHEASGGMQGSVEQMESQIRSIKRYIDRLDADVVKRSKLTYQEFKSQMAAELWIEGVDALDKGLVDRIGYLTINESVDGKGAFNLREELKREGKTVPRNSIRENNLKSFQ